MWEIYDRLIGGIKDDIRVTDVVCGPVWTAVCTDSGSVGMAMSMRGHDGTAASGCSGKDAGCRTDAEDADSWHYLACRPYEKTSEEDVMKSRKPYAGTSYGILREGMTLRDAALLVKAWDFTEASIGMAAINAYYNTKRRIEELDLYQKQEGHSTFGMDVAGKNIVMIGALKSRSVLEAAGAHVTVLEREDKPNTLPDTAAEYVIPGCDILVITASAFINKTIPRLLELGSGAQIVVTGPSAPMSPNLLEFGIRRVTGLVITDTIGAPDFVARGGKQQPYILGEKFCIE